MRANTPVGHHAIAFLIAVIATLVLSARAPEAAPPQCRDIGETCGVKGERCCDGFACAGATKGSNKTPGVCKRANGVACGGNDECASGHCNPDEHICCERECNVPCESCNITPGTCIVNEGSQGGSCSDDLFCTTNET